MNNVKERKWCVYVHIFPNDKKYIGITSQKENQRWRGGKGYKINSIMSKAIRKYGWDNIQHKVLFENLSESEAKQKEIEYISLYKTANKKFGYNRSLGGDGYYGYVPTKKIRKLLAENASKRFKGIKFSPEHSKKISESSKGARWMIKGDLKKKVNKKNIEDYLSLGWEFKKKPKEPYDRSVRWQEVYEFDLNGNVINHWDNLEKASKGLGLPISSIDSALNGHTKTCHKHILGKNPVLDRDIWYLTKIQRNIRPIVAFNLRTKELERYPYLAQVRNLGIDTSNIAGHINKGKPLYAAERLWHYYVDEEDLQKWLEENYYKYDWYYYGGKFCRKDKETS